MTAYNEAQDLANKSKDYMQKEGGDALKQGAKEIKASGKDWWCYVESHPIQSMIFGAIGYLALKGLVKK